MPTHDHDTRLVPPTILVVALLALTGIGEMADLARQIDQLGPRVGDIIAFDPARPAAFDSDARLNATRPGVGDCVLDVTAMRRGGGSLVLEQRNTTGLARSYRVHWAGRRTSEDGADCGTDTDLKLPVDDVGTLAIAAGGFGVPGARPQGFSR